MPPMIAPLAEPTVTCKPPQTVGGRACALAPMGYVMLACRHGTAALSPGDVRWFVVHPASITCT